MIKTPASKFTIRHTTALPKNRTELEALVTRQWVERFLNELGRGALEAEVLRAHPDSGADADASGEFAHQEPGQKTNQTDKLALGDTVTVRLPALEFTGITGLAQMLVAAKAPEKVKSMIENSPVFARVGASLDTAYGYLREGLTFSSKITEWSSNKESLTYVDEGVELPKVLKSWRHTHRISESAIGGMIVDELEVEVDPAIAAPVIEGALRLHLESRAKAYKKLLEQV